MRDQRAGTLAVPQLGSPMSSLAGESEGALQSAEPFDLTTAAASRAEIRAKWSGLHSRILADLDAVAACRSDQGTCSQATRRFLSIVELGQNHDGRARLGWINRAVNLSIKPMSDWGQHGSPDIWTSPLQTLGSGAGDCEDYAIVKYTAFRDLGVKPSDLRLVIVQDPKRQTEHAVVAVRHDQSWLILDNRTMALLNPEQAGHYYPLFTLEQPGIRTMTAAAADRVIDR